MKYYWLSFRDILSDTNLGVCCLEVEEELDSTEEIIDKARDMELIPSIEEDQYIDVLCCPLVSLDHECIESNRFYTGEQMQELGYLTSKQKNQSPN